jgi:hypothetical protein
MTNINYYKALRIQPTATPKEIKAAYRNLSVLFNPDDSKDETAKEIGEIVHEAFMTLNDPEKRALYDIENLKSRLQDATNLELNPAEKIINSWQTFYTTEEQEYIDKVARFNQVVKSIIFLVAVFFIWSVINFRFDIAVTILFGIIFLYRIIWSVYTIKNPPPPPEAWGLE